jgi:hypothetical protein
VSISLFHIARQAVGVMTSGYRDKLAYEVSGELAGAALDRVHFKSSGELKLPEEIFAPDR